MAQAGKGKTRQELLRQGWPTFYGAPPRLNLAGLRADIAFLGVPLDATTNDRPGSRFGPAAIRDASMRYQQVGGAGWLDQEAEEHILQGVSMADCGDVDIRVVDLAQNFAKITRALVRILRRGAFPVLVGGDHAITFPAVRAFSRPLNIVYFDAHHDFTDEWKGVRFSHDNPLRRVSELPWLQAINIVVLRGVLARDRAYWEARDKGVAIVPALEIRRHGVEAALAKAPPSGDCYVSIDIDVLDPAVAPGTGYPEPGGLAYYELKEALLLVAQRCRVVGFDLVEVSPVYDLSQRTARTAARLILDLLGEVFSYRRQVDGARTGEELAVLKGGDYGALAGTG